MRWRRRHRGLACAELVELVTEYLEDALPASERARLEAHLETCPDCRSYVATFLRTVDSLGALPGEPVAGEALERLLAAFRRLVRQA
jgi:anti-sigma factor RsiW